MQNRELEYRKQLVTIKKRYSNNNSFLYHSEQEIEYSLDAFIASEQKQLGIIGGGLSILSQTKGRQILLESPEVQSKVFKDNYENFEYIRSPYTDSVGNNDKYIDLLFVTLRSNSHLEFLKIIPSKDKNQFEYPFQYKLRREYEILHCSSGEILFFSLLWRLVIELIVHNDSKMSISDLYSIKNLWKKKNSWAGKFSDEHDIENNLIEFTKEVNANDNISENIFNSHNKFKDTLLKTSTISEIFKELGLDMPKHIEELNRYLFHILSETGILYISETFDKFDQHPLMLKPNQSEEELQEFSISLIRKFCIKAEVWGNLDSLLSKLHETARFPILPYYFMMFFDNKKNLKEHIVFPVWYTFSNDTAYYGYENNSKKETAILHALYTIKPIWEMPSSVNTDWYVDVRPGWISFKLDDAPSEKFIDYFNQIYTFFSSFCAPIVDIEYYGKELKKQKDAIKGQAVRSAIAQVMTRNMSHNIGSHVLSNLIQDDIYDKLNDKIKCKNKKNYHSKCQDTDGESDENHQLAYFNRYLKSRMDYLSEATFATSNILTTKQLYNDVFKEFDRVRLLLNHISGINDFEFEIVLKNNDGIELSDNSDISAAFPSDVLGCQAFYNIIENIIRNTAKYSKDSKLGLKRFTINIKDIHEEGAKINSKDYQQYYCVEIDDGISIEGKQKRKTGNKELAQFMSETGTFYKKAPTNWDRKSITYAKEIKKYFARKWDTNKGEGINGGKSEYISKQDIEEIDWLVTNQNFRINAAVLKNEKEFILRNHSLGLLEMEFSTSFLRLVDISAHGFRIDNNDKLYNSHGELNLLKAFKTEDNALGYRFFIKKPQDFLFVGDWNLEDDKKNKLTNQGIWFITEDEFKSGIKNGIAFAHRFVISTKTKDDFFDNDKGKFKEHKTLLPNRWVSVANMNGIKNILKIESSTDLLTTLEAKIWEIFFNDISLNEVSLQDEQIDQNNIELKEQQIVLTDHFPKKYSDFIDAKQKNLLINTWIEPLSSNAQKKLPFYMNGDITDLADYVCKINSGNNIVKALLWESYRTPVLVIDERIQEYSKLIRPDKNNVKNIDNKTIFKNSNVFVSNEELSKDVLSVDLINKINSEIKEVKPTFLLVHYGILERAYHSDTEAINNCLEDWTDKGCNVVVTSGRGKHSMKLPKFVRYLNLSSVLYAFVENQNKYSINYILNQARR